MRMQRNRVIGAALLVALALVAAACGGSGDDDATTTSPDEGSAATTTAGGDAGGTTDGPTIVIGSFGFGESEILGEIYKQGLEASGYTVEHNAQIGPREVLAPALESGELSFIPEYVGSALEVTFGEEPPADAAEARDALEAAYAEKGVSVLAVAPAEDKNAFAVLATTAEEFDLTTVSDLAALDQPITLGGPPECPERPRCALGLEDTYGLEVVVTPLDAGGPLTTAALKGDEVQVGLFFSTFIFDPEIVALEDDMGLQPAENIVPVVRTDIVDAYGDAFTSRIDEISAVITTADLTEMNRQFGEEQRDASDIAADYLADQGLG